MAENLTTENLKSASNLTIISQITDNVSVICAENDTLKTFPLKSINREELNTIKTDLEEIKPKFKEYNVKSVDESAGLINNNGKLSVNLSNGLAFQSNGSISVRVGNGLGIDDDQRLKVNINTNGLKIVDDVIQLNVDSKFNFDSTGALVFKGLPIVEYNNGLLATYIQDGNFKGCYTVGLDPTFKQIKDVSYGLVFDEKTGTLSLIPETKLIKTFGNGLIYDEENKKLSVDDSKYKQNYAYNDLGVYITGAHNYGKIVCLGGRFTADISYNSITYFIDVLFEAKNDNLYARVLSNNSPLSICQVTDDNGLNQFYLMNKNGTGIYTVNVLQYSDFTLKENIKLSANVSNELFKPFTVINPIDEPPIESGSYSLNVEVTQNENHSYQQLNQYSPKTIEVGTDVIRVEITDSGGAIQLTLLPGETKEYSGVTYSFIDGVVTASLSWYNQGMKTYKLVYKELSYKWKVN